MIEHITDSPRFYEYVAWAVVALAAFNFFQIAYLLWNKARVERSERRKDKFKRLAATAIVTALSPADLLSPPSSEDEYAAYAESIASVLDSFAGEVADRAAGLLTVFGIGAHYRALARSRSWYKRCNAVDMLTVFRLEENRDFFAGLFAAEPSADVKYRIVRGLSLIVRGGDDVRELAGMLSGLPYLAPKYTEDVFYNAIIRLKLLGKEDEFGGFMRAIMRDGRVPAAIKRDCVTACYAAICEKGRPLLKEYYAAHPDEPEILAACVRALARAGDFTLLPGALRHPDWRVRLAALKHAHLCCEDLTGEIAELLSDLNYHVRLNAAMTLARAGERGLAALRAAAASRDRFAAETAAYALEQEAVWNS
ncbi:MAG: HEAT repeat domain-containing protein [Elusimicrobiales bacterium]|nr:HEAT repeat domain-containing protein [Elusimicrobiales bacterium]